MAADPTEQAPAARLVDTPEALAALAAKAVTSPRVALDLEANGRFAYRAKVSMLQLATGDEVVVVDPLGAIGGDLSSMRALLSSAGPVKIIHDVGYDARLLAEVGLTLGNVHDTALAAQWLGRPATGLGSLLRSELDVTVDKSLQAQDWSARPLSPRSLAYLADDVAHLFALDDRLWGEATEHGITVELLEETAYRLATAVRSVTEPDPRPPFARVKGSEDLTDADLAVLRRVALARETEAERLDTPAGELVPSAVLVAIARMRPASMKDLDKIRRPVARLDAPRVALALLEAVRQGVADGALSPEDAAWRERKKIPKVEIVARREREGRLSAWRKKEAAARGVDPQVVLPGHCLNDLSSSAAADRDALRLVDGVGAFRVERYGDAILAAVRGGP